MIKKSRSTLLLLGITASVSLLIFVYFEKKVRRLENHDLVKHSNVVYSRDEDLDLDGRKRTAAGNDHSNRQTWEKAINLKLQLPLKGQTFNPVVRKFMEQLQKHGELEEYINIANIDQAAKSHLLPRNTELTGSDLKNIQNCKANSKQAYQNNYGAFFGGDHGRLQNIRRTHHTYLNAQSLMIEVGGNWGWDAGNFSKLYNMYYIILEPLTPYTDILEKKFFGNDKISVYNIGLGSENEVIMVNLEGNNACATTKFSKKNGTVPIYIVNAIDFLTSLGVGVYELDLLTMNCEGCEFEVLETLVKSNLVEKIRNIQWATHTQISIADPWGRYCRIQELLKRTHRSTYQYKFNWESWRRKDLK